MELKIIKQDWQSLKRWFIIEPECHGIIQLDIYKQQQKDNVQAYICNFSVNKQHRKKGIGKELLKAAEEIAKRQGYKYAYLIWNSADTPVWVYSWYIRNGYEHAGFKYEKILLSKKL
jgi:ribosomal protein S18 acetylase RimI-like enzyme